MSPSPDIGKPYLDAGDQVATPCFVPPWKRDCPVARRERTAVSGWEWDELVGQHLNQRMPRMGIVSKARLEPWQNHAFRFSRAYSPVPAAAALTIVMIAERVASASWDHASTTSATSGGRSLTEMGAFSTPHLSVFLSTGGRGFRKLFDVTALRPACRGLIIPWSLVRIQPGPIRTIWGSAEVDLHVTRATVPVDFQEARHATAGSPRIVTRTLRGRAAPSCRSPRRCWCRPPRSRS
jgi:hypothetical protein